jgi:hypothetical protein
MSDKVMGCENKLSDYKNILRYLKGIASREACPYKDLLRASGQTFDAGTPAGAAVIETSLLRRLHSQPGASSFSDIPETCPEGLRLG